MIIKDNLILISYTPYQYKEGGFCVTLNCKNESKMQDITLTEKEISELRKFKVNKNKTPLFTELIDEYFESLNTEII